MHQKWQAAQEPWAQPVLGATPENRWVSWGFPGGLACGGNGRPRLIASEHPLVVGSKDRITADPIGQ